MTAAATGVRIPRDVSLSPIRKDGALVTVGQTFSEGWMLMRDPTTGYLQVATEAAGLLPGGFADRDFYVAAVAGDFCNVDVGLRSVDMATGVDTFTGTDPPAPIYAINNNDFGKTSNAGTRSIAGCFLRVDPLHSTKCLAWIGPEGVAVAMALAGQDEVVGSTSDGFARLVATNIPAGAFSGGVWTATATGVFPTQDGVAGPLTLGDVLIFPPGTITTQAVTAAQSGPYVCTTVGAVGVKAVFSRPSWWAHGALIKMGSKVTVGGEGTTYHGTSWVAKPLTNALVVDTGDPLQFPAEMIVPLVLASGTHAAVTTVPLRAAGLFAILFDFTGGSPAATATSIQATTQTPGPIGTASIVPFEMVALGTTVGTGSSTCNMIVRQ